ncbi:MAG: AAA family ATPase [Dermatophilaceae bacterium]
MIFLDEVDALGPEAQSQTRYAATRSTVNQLLTELDGVIGTSNEGVFVIGATNQPWDVDPASAPPWPLRPHPAGAPAGPAGA